MRHFFMENICLQISCVPIRVWLCCCVRVTKAKSPHFCNDTHPTLWWLCLKIFTVTCSESSALFLYRSLPVQSALSGRLLILWDLPQMFYTFLVFRVLYVLETFVFHFMIIKENIQVCSQTNPLILTTQQKHTRMFHVKGIIQYLLTLVISNLCCFLLSNKNTDV